MENLILISFIGGIISVLSPCVLPILPVIMAGSIGHRLRPLAIVVGMATAFSLMGVLTSTVGGTLAGYARFLRTFGALVIIFMGSVFLSKKIYEKFVISVSVIMQKFHPGKMQEANRGIYEGFILGLSLGTVWVPCVGPIVGSILVMVAIRGEVLFGGLALFSYAVGIGIPLLIIVYAGKLTSGKLKWVARHGESIKITTGIVLVLTGVAMLLGLDIDIQILLYPYFPEIEFGGLT